MSDSSLGAYETLPVEKLVTFHQNPRRGNVEVIAESLVSNRQYRPIVVNRGTKTGRKYEVLAGNHTLLAARYLVDKGVKDFEQLDCWVIDVDDDAARRIVLADNRTSDLSSYDDQDLVALLEQMEGDLSGTGWLEEDLSELIEVNQLTNTAPIPEDEWASSKQQQPSDSKEVDPEEWSFNRRCPSCGFEWEE